MKRTWVSPGGLNICCRFAVSSSALPNDVDTAHWNNLFKLTERYGTEDLNGWLLKFIPYVRHDKNETAKHRNPVFSPQREEPNLYKVTGCTSDMLPSGLSSVTVTSWDKNTGKTTPLRFLAGFGGVQQASDTLGLRPMIVWSIATITGVEGILAELQKTQIFHGPYRLTFDDVIKTFRDYLPGDLWKFYSITNGLCLSFQNKNQWDETHINIKSISEIGPVLDKESVKRELGHLLERGSISPDLYKERLEFVYRFGGLLVIGEVFRPANNIYYVFGDDIRSPSRWLDPENETEASEEPNQDQIFRWDGSHTTEGFVPVARNFTQWLQQMVAQGVKPVEPDPHDPQPS